MTRLLSTLLAAREPAFRLGLAQLEASHGHPAHDIRLTSEIIQAAKTKLQLLGLDPHDTTGRELYRALQERLRADDARLEKTLRTTAATYVSAEADPVDGMVHTLLQLPVNRSCYALKSSTVKAQLKKQPPKRVMKQLGYRSLDSLLRHESPAHILAAAWLVETPAWRKSYLDRYRSLTPRDFENRQITVSKPAGKRWAALASGIVAAKRHNLISFKELGAVVLLPLPAAKPAGSTTAAIVLALHAMNDIRAASSFLQLTQVRGDFGRLVQLVVSDGARLDTHLLDRTVPWELVHRFYARLRHLFREDLFEPYLHLEDLAWHPVEQVLSLAEPAFAFWRDSSHLGVVHEGQRVSLNLLDGALNLCNDLPYERRLAHYGQSALGHEVMLRYLKPSAIEQAVKTTMQPQLASEEVLV